MNWSKAIWMSQKWIFNTYSFLFKQLTGSKYFWLGSKIIWTSPKQLEPVQNLFEPIKGTSHNILKMTYDMNIRYKISKQGWGDGQGPNHIFRVFPIINIDKLMKTVLFGLGLIPCRHQGFETQGCNHLNWSHTSKEPHTDLQLKIEKSTYFYSFENSKNQILNN